MEQWRIYRLCKLFGCTPSELDDQPAVLCDWLLAIDDLYAARDVRREQGRRPA